MTETIPWPFDVDSMGKLREAVAECGVPQRDTMLYGPDVTCWPEATIISIGAQIPPDDRVAANMVHRALVRCFSGALYKAMATMSRGKRWVWRVRPEIEESDATDFSTKLFIFRVPSQPGGRIAGVECRYWIEDAE